MGASTGRRVSAAVRPEARQRQPSAARVCCRAVCPCSAAVRASHRPAAVAAVLGHATQQLRRQPAAEGLLIGLQQRHAVALQTSDREIIPRSSHKRAVRYVLQMPTKHPFSLAPHWLRNAAQSDYQKLSARIMMHATTDPFRIQCTSPAARRRQRLDIAVFRPFHVCIGLGLQDGSGTWDTARVRRGSCCAS